MIQLKSMMTDLVRRIADRSILLLLLSVLPATLDGQLVVNSQFRNRLELRNGYQRLSQAGSVPAIFMSQRTRLGLLYDSPSLRIRFFPQDVRIWGDEQNASLAGVTGDHASIDLFEGYFEIRIGENNWVSIGRQQLVYDNEWLLSARNWNQNGISSDAVVFKSEGDVWKFHAGFSWNTFSESRMNNYYPVNRYKTLNYLWYNREIIKNLKLSPIYLLSGRTAGDNDNKIYLRHTTGLFSNYSRSNLFASLNIYYQFGKSQSGLPVDALLAAGEAGMKGASLTTAVGFSGATGNKDIGIGQSSERLFDIMYTSRHRYFGNIDYFRDMAVDTRQGGLTNYYAYLELKVSARLSLRNTVHYFMLSALNQSSPADRKLGLENDLVLKFRISEWGNLESGFLFFRPEESLMTIHEITDPSKLSFFSYLMLTINPTLFRQ